MVLCWYAVSEVGMMLLLVMLVVVVGWVRVEVLLMCRAGLEAGRDLCLVCRVKPCSDVFGIS